MWSVSRRRNFFGGTDKLSYGAIPKFREFVDFANQKYKHTIIEGDRFFK